MAVIKPEKDLHTKYGLVQLLVKNFKFRGIIRKNYQSEQKRISEGKQGYKPCFR